MVHCARGGAEGARLDLSPFPPTFWNLLNRSFSQIAQKRNKKLYEKKYPPPEPPHFSDGYAAPALVVHCSVWILQTFPLTLFCRKFRESNVFSKYVCWFHGIFHTNEIECPQHCAIMNSTPFPSSSLTLIPHTTKKCEKYNTYSII